MNVIQVSELDDETFYKYLEEFLKDNTRRRNLLLEQNYKLKNKLHNVNVALKGDNQK